MSPEKLFHELLGLGMNWQVTELAYLKGGRGEVRIIIDETGALFESLNCSEDGSSVSLYDHSAKRTWRHLNIFEYECFIECSLPRVKCSNVVRLQRLKLPGKAVRNQRLTPASSPGKPAIYRR